MKSTYIIYWVGIDINGNEVAERNSEITVTNAGEGFLSTWREIAMNESKDDYPSVTTLLIKHICKL